MSRRLRNAGVTGKSKQNGDRAQLSYLRFLLPVLALWLVPVLLFIIVVPLAGHFEKADITDPSTPKTVLVGSRTQDLRQGVDVAFTMDTGSVIASPLPGVITAIGPEVGDQIKEGSFVASVDGSPIFAVSGEAPLYRDLTEGMRGPDVTTMSRLLATQGFLNPEDIDSVVGPKILHGIKSFQEAIGDQQSGVFRYSYTVYIADVSVPIASISARIGDVVEKGRTLLSMQDRPQQVRITSASAQAGSGNDTSLSTLAGKEIVISAGGSTLPLRSLEPSVDEVPQLYDFLESSTSGGAIKAIKESANSNGSEASQSVLTFSGALVSLRDPVITGTVSAPAVYTGGEGKLCVFTVSAEVLTTVDVSEATAMSGEIGLVAVPTALIGERVLADATKAPDSAKKKCG